MSSVNPYAAPTARVDDVPANPEAEAIRRAHISHEASVKAVGFLYYLGGAIIVVLGFAALVGGPLEPADVAIAAGLLAFGAGQLAAGWGVRALQPWGRIAGCVLSAIGLLGFPIGTLINGYILYLLLSKKGATLFSPSYQDVIAATPHVKYRTSILVWIVLALLAALLLFGLFSAAG